MISLLLLALTAWQASAQVSTCADALEKVHARYFTELEDLQKQEKGYRWGSNGIGAVGVACVLKTRSLVLCGLGTGGMVAVGKGMQWRMESKIKALEDGYKMYEVFYQLENENLEDEAVRDLVKQLNLSPSQEHKVFEEFGRMVNTGEICAGGSTVQKSWEDVLEILKQKKD